VHESSRVLQFFIGGVFAWFSRFSKIQIGFAFLVPAYPGSPGQMGVCVIGGGLADTG